MRGLTAALVAAVLVLGGCAGDRAPAGNGTPGDLAPSPGAGAATGAGSGSGDEPRGGTKSRPGPGTEPGTGTGPVAGNDPGAGLVELRVLADESLTEVLGTVEQGFEAHHPNIEVVLTYAEGGNLARRITGGESADVFATDDLFAMRTVTDAVQGADPAEEFGGGRLTVIVLPAAAEPKAAAAFVDFLREGAGQRILIDSGVERP
ncbi:substrate-binding domain-containing protein [Actinoplanes sp. NPDC023801]|uniref:molybdate ABC transporter substrate-binding protein n=1 Tax=Actinoplanes sp. NPDC023801 TaxID=3154595 RepID=UPI0033D2B91A